MNIGRPILSSSSAMVASLCIAAMACANGTPIRWLQMGEFEGAVANTAVSTAYDTPIDGSDFQQINLAAVNSPTYRTISSRPDGGGGIGIEFDPALSQYLVGSALNWPERSPWSDTEGGAYNLQGIEDRGIQFWVRPTSTAMQTLVMDTNRHGVRINSSGKFSMRFSDVDYDSTMTVVSNTWYHIELIRPAGEASRSRLYVNGVAAAVSAAVDYHSDTVTSMTVGANTSEDGEFFKGIVDDLKMYVYGATTSGATVDYGSWNFKTDNAFVASPVTGLKGVAGDVTNNGVFDSADKTAFIAGWMHKHLVSGVQIGDMFSYGEGDLNLDGITDIQDLLLIQNALTAAGMGTISLDDLTGVPEPATALLAGLIIVPLAIRRSNRQLICN